MGSAAAKIPRRRPTVHDFLRRLPGDAALGLLILILAVLRPAAAHADEDEDVLRIGSKRFTESYVLGEILARTAAEVSRVEYRAGLGNTAILLAALKERNIDLYPEYTGTVAAEVLKRPEIADCAPCIDDALRALGLGLAIHFGFNDRYALALRQAQAQENRITTVSRLADFPAMRLGLSQEFLGRSDGWPGLAGLYRLPQKPIALDHGLAYEAIAAGQVDVIDIYSTDAKIAKYSLQVLADDRHFFPGYDAVVLYRLDVPRRFPAAWAALGKLAGRIDEAKMISMNGEVELEGRGFAAVADEFLARPADAGSKRAGPESFWSKLFGPDFGRLTWQHLKLVLTSVGLAVIIGVPLGVAAALRPRTGSVILALTGALQTIPSLALLAMLIPLVGSIGTPPALIALFLYALLPIVRNACVGVTEIPQGMKLAALALGLSTWNRIRYIDVPLAATVIAAGVKTAAVLSVGTATIAAFIGAGGYGERISIGLALNDNQLLLAGAIPAAVLAVLTQVLFELAEHWLGRHRSAL